MESLVGCGIMVRGVSATTCGTRGSHTPSSVCRPSCVVHQASGLAAVCRISHVPLVLVRTSWFQPQRTTSYSKMENSNQGSTRSRTSLAKRNKELCCRSVTLLEEKGLVCLCPRLVYEIVVTVGFSGKPSLLVLDIPYAGYSVGLSFTVH